MEIQCKYKQDDGLYFCQVKKAIIKTQGVVINSVKGDHLATKSNNDVLLIFFYADSVVNFVPKGLDKIFPNLVGLTIYNCGLKEISRRDLIGLEGLEIIDLQKNDLQLLSDDLFISMPNLRCIYFDGNKIKFLSSQLLKPLIGRHFGISLTKNTAIDEWFDPHKMLGGLAPSASDKPCQTDINRFMKIIDEKCMKPEYKTSAAQRAITANENSWSTGLFSDFLIKAGGKEFRVHKVILGQMSPVLEAVFEHRMQEGETGELIIEDFKADVVEDFLRFIYTGEFNKVLAMDLFAISAKYQVLSLKMICEDIVKANVDDKNALEVLALGDLYSSNQLKTAAFPVIKRNAAFNIPDKLKDDPDALRKLMEADKIRQAAKRKADEVFENLLKKHCQ